METASSSTKQVDEESRQPLARMVVNDLVSFTGTHAALQAKADLVSAICLIFGLEAPAHKLRCFHPNRLAPTHTHSPTSLAECLERFRFNMTVSAALGGPLGHERGQQHTGLLGGAGNHTAINSLDKDD